MNQAIIPGTIILGATALIFLFSGSHALEAKPIPWYEQPNQAEVQFDWAKMQAEGRAAITEATQPKVITVPIQLSVPAPEPILISIVPAQPTTTFSIPTLSTKL